VATDEHAPRTNDVPGYDLLERIGRGPRAEVWKARRHLNGKEVAVKVLSPDLARRPNFLTLFEKETSALTALTHANTVSTIERGRSGRHYFLVQELMRAGSLRETIRRGPLPLDRVVQIASGIAEALDYAHRRGLMHRHLVAENVFVDGANVVRVGDFSLSALSATATGGDVAADLVDFGSLLHELLTGAPPGPRLVPLEGRFSGANKRLDEFLARILATNPAERFRRISEVSLALLLLQSDDAPAKESPVDDSDDGVSVFAKERLVLFKLPARAAPQTAKASLQAIQRALTTAGPWKIGYDLSESNILDDAIQVLISSFHGKNAKSLSRVAFCSPRALVRASALVIGQAHSRAIASKLFAAPEPMRRWLAEEG
jgi:serine/threonine protein kinase